MDSENNLTVQYPDMILIIQNGFINTQVAKYLDEEYELVKSYETDVTKLAMSKYSVVIILGGHQSITDIGHYEYLLNVVTLVKQCIQSNKPVIGFCLGCHIIAYALGCEIKSSDKLNHGYDSKILGFDHIFRCHYDYIVPNNEITIIEKYESMPYLISHGKIYGIQCHPDIPPETVRKYHADDNKCCIIAQTDGDIIDKNNAALMSYLLKEVRKN